MSSRTSKQAAKSTTLMVRLDKQSKETLAKAATLRKISISDYIRVVTLSQARKEIAASRDQVISLSAAEQLAFWMALNDAKKLTPAQKKLAKIMRGES